MTTNHRPTFESRRGRELQPTSIVHARSLPAHKQLKLRSTAAAAATTTSTATRVDEASAKEKLQQLKKELLEREGGHDTLSIEPKSLVRTSDEVAMADDEEQETYAEKRRRIQQETANDDGEDDDDDDDDSSEGSSSEDEDESSDDDEDDVEALKAELEKIKREREEEKRQRELEERKEQALNSNPLLSTQAGVKKSWRQATVFSNSSKSSSTALAKRDDKNNYVNDALRSDFHRRFLDRYIK